MDPHNSREGLKEALTDVEEGADIIMVKPALAYQDMIWQVKEIQMFRWLLTVSAVNMQWSKQQLRNGMDR